MCVLGGGGVGCNEKNVEGSVVVCLCDKKAPLCYMFCMYFVDLIVFVLCASGSRYDDNDDVLLYVHRNRRLIRDGSPGRPHRLLHSS